MNRIYEIPSLNLVNIVLYAATACSYETTAAALLFTSYLLARNPEVQRRLQEEIDSKFSEEEAATYDNVFELQYLDMVLSESMRVYPPIPRCASPVFD